MSQTVSRALDILKFTSVTPRSLNEIVAHVGVHKSTALRLLQALEQEGFARTNDAGRYTVGFGIIPLAQRAIDQIDVRTIAHPHLQALADEHGHTVHLAQLIGDDIIYVDKVDGNGTVAMGFRIGLHAEAHTAGVAKVILAQVDKRVRDRMLNRLDYTGYTSTTITTREAFGSELIATAERGWAEDNGEKEDYINCVALPVYAPPASRSWGYRSLR